MCCSQEQAELQTAGYEPEVIREAGEVSLEAVRSILKQLPPFDWVSSQVRQAMVQTMLQQALKQEVDEASSTEDI